MTSYPYLLALVVPVDVPEAYLATHGARGHALPLLRAAYARDLVRGRALAPEDERNVHLDEGHGWTGGGGLR